MGTVFEVKKEKERPGEASYRGPQVLFCVSERPSVGVWGLETAFTGNFYRVRPREGRFGKIP